MALGQREIKVVITGDARSLERAFGKAEREGKSFNSTLGRVGKTAAFTAGGIGIGALTVALHDGFKEFQAAEEAAAQTQAVLKSTGGAAHVTAKQVSELSTQLMKQSGIDDELIQQGENLLLGFTNIRNEVGKGNDIFNQATRVMLDFSVRTGRDAPSAAILLGKALNDPIKGMGVLARVGIRFTEAQQNQIRAMVAAGNVMGAQKIILAELETRYGGAAKAAGETLPGQLNILRESLHNLEGQAFVQALNTAKEFTPALQNIATVIGTLSPLIKTLSTLIIKDLLTPMIVVSDLLTGKWSKAWKDALGPVQAFIDTVRTAADLLKSVTGTFHAGGDFEKIAKQKRAQKGFMSGSFGGTSLPSFMPNAAAAGASNAGGIVVHNLTVVSNDPDDMQKKLQRKARRGVASRSGPYGGHALGLT